MVLAGVTLDVSTLYLVATLVAAMLGALLLFFWRQEKIPALGWWGAAYLIGAGSIGTWTLGGPLLGRAGLLVVSVIGFAACGMVWNAARVFHGRKPAWFRLFAGAAVWALTALILDSSASLLRSFILASIIAAYAT